MFQIIDYTLITNNLGFDGIIYSSAGFSFKCMKICFLLLLYPCNQLVVYSCCVSLYVYIYVQGLSMTSLPMSDKTLGPVSDIFAV